MPIIGFIGNKGAGKSYAAKFLAEKFTGEVHSFAGALKEFINELGIPCDRKNLIQYGNALQQIFTKHIFVQALAKRIAGLVESGQNVYIDDVRFPQEIMFLHKIGAAVVFIDAEVKDMHRRVFERGRRDDQINYYDFTLSLQSEYSELLASKISENKEGFPAIIKIENKDNLAKFDETLIDLYYTGKIEQKPGAAQPKPVGNSSNYT